MKLSSCSWVWAALYAISSVSAQGQEPAATAAATPSYEQAPEPTQMLELRQVQQDPNAAASPEPSQAPIATTNWVETSLAGGAVTYVPEAYTQLFSPVPDQWPSPGVGTIGYGTLKQNKRDVEAVQTASSLRFAQPAVLVLRTVYCVQPVQRVIMVEIVETVTELVLPVTTATSNATLGYGYGNANGTGLATGTGFSWSTGTAASGYGVHHNLTATASSYLTAASSGILPLPYYLTHLPDGPWNGHIRSSP